MANHNQQRQQNHLIPKPTSQQQQEVVVVMVPLPAQGHLNQLLHLSTLILSYNIPVHFVGAVTHNRQAKLRSATAATTAVAIQFHDFEIPPFPSPPPNPNSKNKFPSHLIPSFKASSHLREPVSLLLRSLSSQARKVIVIHDSLMASVVQDVRFLPNAESYTFHSISAFAIYLFKKETTKKTSGVSEELINNVPSLDGCYTKEFLDFVSSQHGYHEFNSGFIYNTCRLVEGEHMELLEKEFSNGKKLKHFALGPFNPVRLIAGSSKDKHLCFEWLDKQERNSVIYVSFGTTTAMEDEQIKELAIGLKQSNHKFIWVLREADKGDVFIDGNEEKRGEVSRGFEELLANEMGLIVRDWAPQLDILGHEAIGGFISHCGWNSCMESICMGVPIAAWPMHSDQPRNAFLLSQVLEVGIVVKEWERRDEIVTCKVVESAIKRLMGSEEGEELRRRAAELGDAVRRSVEEEGGSCRSELDSFIEHITRG